MPYSKAILYAYSDNDTSAYQPRGIEIQESGAGEENWTLTIPQLSGKRIWNTLFENPLPNVHYKYRAFITKDTGIEYGEEKPLFYEEDSSNYLFYYNKIGGEKYVV